MTSNEIIDLVILIISIVLTVNIVLAIITLFLERRDSVSLWAWILVMTFIPVLGFLLYVFVGRRLSRNKIFSLLEGSGGGQGEIADRQRAALVSGELTFANQAAAEHKPLVKLLMSNQGAPLSEDNQVTVFHDGNAKFDALIEDIRGAQDHVHLLYYIFRADNLGLRIIDALTERAKAGVEVRLCFDALGGKTVKKKHIKALLDAGGEVYPFFPNKIPLINFRINYRTHRKMAVIDGHIGWVGGFNVGDEYLGTNPKFGYWRDTHLRIVGSAVPSIQKRLLMDWNTTCPLERRVPWAERYFPETEQGDGHGPGTVAIQIASSGPDSAWERIKFGYINMIGTATKSIFIQTPYFMPDAALMDALKIAARSGIDVRMMIPDKPDHLLVYPATLAFCDELVECGAKIFIYRGGFMHAKTIVVDEVVASVGTANFDNRSFRLNFEVNAFTYDHDLGRELADIFRMDQEKCTLFDHKEVYRRPVIGRIKEGISRLVAPLL